MAEKTTKIRRGDDATITVVKKKKRVAVRKPADKVKGVPPSVDKKQRPAPPLATVVDLMYSFVKNALDLNDDTNPDSQDLSYVVTAPSGTGDFQPAAVPIALNLSLPNNPQSVDLKAIAVILLAQEPAWDITRRLTDLIEEATHFETSWADEIDVEIIGEEPYRTNPFRAPLPGSRASVVGGRLRIGRSAGLGQFPWQSFPSAQSRINAIQGSLSILGGAAEAQIEKLTKEANESLDPDVLGRNFWNVEQRNWYADRGCWIVNSTSGGFSVEFRESIYFEEFNTEDTANFKVTKDPWFEADEVPVKLKIDTRRKERWFIGLTPRFWKATINNSNFMLSTGLAPDPPDHIHEVKIVNYSFRFPAPGTPPAAQPGIITLQENNKYKLIDVTVPEGAILWEVDKGALPFQPFESIPLTASPPALGGNNPDLWHLFRRVGQGRNGSAQQLVFLSIPNPFWYFPQSLGVAAVGENREWLGTRNFKVKVETGDAFAGQLVAAIKYADQERYVWRKTTTERESVLIYNGGFDDVGEPRGFHFEQTHSFFDPGGTLTPYTTETVTNPVPGGITSLQDAYT